MNKRQTYRAYATDAFRFLAREGSKEKYIKKLVEEMQRSISRAGINSPTESSLIHKEQVLRDKAAELFDLEAVEKVMRCSTKEMRQALEMVCMKDCWKDLEWGDISSRVHYAELHIPASQAQIYRWLAKSCLNFARERGLRI